MRLLQRHRLIWLFIGLLLSTLVALFVAYDSRSPFSQFVRGFGTVTVDRWTAAELDAACIRLEPPIGMPTVWADAALPVASKAFPDGHLREIVLTSLRDPCNGGGPRLAWAVVLEWAPTTDLSASSGTLLQRPRAIVLVDAVTGDLITSRAEGQP
jgi:hypothetical protein